VEAPGRCAYSLAPEDGRQGQAPGRSVGVCTFYFTCFNRNKVKSMMMSLSRYIGTTKSRTVKKLVFYSILPPVGYIVFCVTYTTMWLLGIADQLAMDLGLPGYAWLFIAFFASPMLIYFVGRTIYKYAHLRDQVVQEHERNMELWELVTSGREDALRSISGTKIVRDQGEDGLVDVELERAKRILQDAKEIAAFSHSPTLAKKPNRPGFYARTRM
jgi:hypothetical protein